jgi:signal transduction histidine kinase/CheY-like chemotaxis protein/CHASE3 domain sensor protein
MKNYLKLKVVVSLCIGFLIVLFIEVAYYKNIQELIKSKNWISNTYNVISQTHSIFSILAITESEVRGYVITGKMDFLNIYKVSSKELKNQINELKWHTRDHPGLQERVSKLEFYAIAKLEFLQRIVLKRSKEGKAPAMDLIGTGVGKVLMDKITYTLKEIEKEEYRLLKIRNSESERITSKVIMIGLYGGAMALLVIVFSGIFIIKDFNRRKKTLTELEENKSRINKFLDALPLGVFVLNADGKPYYANEKSLDILGKGIDPNIKPGALAEVYKSFKEGTDTEYPASEMPIVKALSGLSSSISDMEIRNNNKSVMLEVTAQPVYDRQGQLLFAIAAFQDITERKKSEKELFEAKKIAQESALLKERFLANMSHEIRTPLNAIIGFSDLIDTSQIKEEYGEYIQAIKTSGVNLLAIVNDILDLSKIDAGKIVVEKTPFNIRSLLNSLNILMANKAKEKNIKLIIHNENSFPQYLSGDPTRLSQILINLIGNAIKFTENGQVEVTCSVKNEAADALNFEFKVQDTGIGISKDEQAIIFERFNQANSETTRKYGGTGLGLSIAKNLVEIQGGALTVESEPGKGSTFTFTIPYQIASVSERSAINSSMDNVKKTQLGPLKILLAEDNELNQKLALKVLSRFGFETDIASNGKIAVKMLEEKSYAVVLMDMQMPEMGGYEATAVIRKMGNDVPVIAMTAHALPGEKEKCIAGGMNDYISKPFKAMELYEKIAMLVNKSTDKSMVGMEVPTDHSGENKVSDLSYLMELSQHSNRFIVEMIELFFKKFPIDLAQLEDAISKEDYQLIKTTSHKIRSSVNIMGIEKAETLLFSIEDLSKEKTGIAVIREHFAVLKPICDQAFAEINAEKAGFLI